MHNLKIVISPKFFQWLNIYVTIADYQFASCVPYFRNKETNLVMTQLLIVQHTGSRTLLSN